MTTKDPELTRRANELSPRVARILGLETLRVEAGFDTRDHLGPLPERSDDPTAGCDGGVGTIRRAGIPVGRFIVLRPGTTEAMQDFVLAHEITHWYLASYGLPRFLDEGLAGAVGIELTPHGKAEKAAMEENLASTGRDVAWAAVLSYEQLRSLSEEDVLVYYALAYDYVARNRLLEGLEKTGKRGIQRLKQEGIRP